MARFAKNKELWSSSYSVRIPHAPGAVGPNYPVDAQLRFNETVDKLQYYYDGEWRNIAREGKVVLSKDTFTGDGTTDEFTMTKTYSASGDELYVLVHIDGVHQIPGVAYTIDGNKITFSSPPPIPTPSTPSKVTVIHGLGSTEIA